jgi:hypothetical protein
MGSQWLPAAVFRGVTARLAAVLPDRRAEYPDVKVRGPASRDWVRGAERSAPARAWADPAQVQAVSAQDRVAAGCSS